MKAGFLIVGLDTAHPVFSVVSKKDRSSVPSVVGVSSFFQAFFG